METLYEIYQSIKQNKIRTLLSGFGISWGILILVVLLGMGRGFQNSVMDVFSIFAQKSLYVYGGITSVNHKNIREGETVRFDMHFIENLKRRFGDIEAISPEMSNGAFTQIIHEGRNGYFKITGVNADYMHIKVLRIEGNGRNLNEGDNRYARNVAVIGENVRTTLFGKQEALGKSVNIGGVYFKVIGVLKNDDIFSASEVNSVYIPYESYRNNVDNSSPINAFCLYLSKDADTHAFENELRAFTANKLCFSYEDKQALQIINLETQTSAFEELFKGLNVFIWIVGICFLISGIVGVCNIMFVVIKERTCEIGIRMALGATPKSILILMLTESVIITIVAGFIGLAAGVGILEIIDRLLSVAESTTMMKQVEIDINTGILSLIVLIISGIIAGAFPAMKASTIQPIDAIRNENIG